MLKGNRRSILSDSEIDNVDTFVRESVRTGRMLACNLHRNKTCINRFFLDYNLSTKEGKHLVSVKKMPFHCQSTYHISLTSNYAEKSEAFLAKVTGNFTGSMYNIWEEVPGVGPELAATIIYQHECFGCHSKAREVEVYLKDSDTKYSLLEGVWLSEGKNLKEVYE